MWVARQDSRPNSRQIKCTEPYRDANDGEEYACVHPKSRKDKDRNGDKPNDGGVVRKFCKRTVNITDYRNSKEGESSEESNVWWHY